MSADMDQTMQISRVILNKNGDVTGIVTVLIQYDKTKTALTQRSHDTAILYNDYYWISGNFSLIEYPFLKEEMRKIEKAVLQSGFLMVLRNILWHMSGFRWTIPMTFILL